MKRKNQSAVAYFFRNIGRILPLCILPAVIFALFSYANRVPEFWADYFAGKFATTDALIAEYIRSYTTFNLSTNWSLLIVLAGIVLMCVAWSVIVYTTDRHMQWGVKVNGDIRNSMLLLGRMIVFVSIALILLEVFNYLCVGILYFSAYAFSVSQLSIIAIVVTILTRLAFGTIIGTFMLSIPAISAEDMPFNVAISYSARLAYKRRNGFSLMIGLIYTAKYVAVMAICTVIDNNIVTAILLGCYYLLWIAFLPILACTRYITDASAERRDLWSKYERGML